MGKLGGVESIEVDAPIEECWALAEDVASAPEWQGGLEKIEALETDDQGRIVVANSTSDAKVRMVTTRVRFTYDEPTRLSWEQEKGDLKSLVGAWVLEDLGDGRTKVTYELEGDPGRVLGMLIRGPVEDRLRQMLVSNRPQEFKDKIEGG
jgi:ribosome-associated toxin RatA of RatAB toxin-antitoxin module